MKRRSPPGPATATSLSLPRDCVPRIDQMPLFVSCRCNRAVPLEAASAIGKAAEINENQIRFMAERNGSWVKVFETLKKHGVFLARSITLADMSFLGRNWSRPMEEWCAAVIDYEFGLVGCNPPEDYFPPLRPPEKSGYIKFEKPLLVNEKPQGQLDAVGESRIFSSRLVRALGGGPLVASVAMLYSMGNA